MDMSGYLNKFFHLLNKPSKKSIIDEKKIFGQEVEVSLYAGASHDSTFYNTKSSILFHTYWCGYFDRKQCLSIKSLLATQNSYSYNVWLWIDEKDKDINENNPWLKQIESRVQIKYYDPQRDVTEDIFKPVKFLFKENRNLAFRADSFRMWALYRYGGVWFDLDIMFLKDLYDLLKGPEFVYAWEKCYYANNAVIYMRSGSYINEYLARKVVKKCTTQPWSLFDYSDRKLRNLCVYPASLFDPVWVGREGEYPIESFEDFFVKSQDPSTKSMDLFPYSYAYHWHNCWKTNIERDSYFELFEKEFNNMLGITS